MHHPSNVLFHFNWQCLIYTKNRHYSQGSMGPSLMFHTSFTAGMALQPVQAVALVVRYDLFWSYASTTISKYKKGGRALHHQEKDIYTKL